MGDTSAKPERVRTLVCDSAELVRRGIRDVLTKDGQFVVVGEIARPEDVPGAYLDMSPGITLLGLGRGRARAAEESAGLHALRQVIQVDPSARVITLVDEDSMDDLMQPVRAGAKGVLLRDALASTLLEAVRDVMEGGAALDPRLTRSLFDSFATRPGFLGTDISERRLSPSVLHLLSPREQEVLRALAKGYRNKEIAAALDVSVGTVKTHFRHIFRKLKVTDRTAAVLTALQARLPEAA